MTPVQYVLSGATKRVRAYSIVLIALYVIYWSFGICRSISRTTKPSRTRQLNVADLVRKSETSSLLNITVRLIDAEADTAIANARLLVVDENTGRTLSTSPDSLGFKLSAPPGSTLAIQASAPGYLAAKTRIINLAVSQQVILKLLRKKPSMLTIKAFAVKIDRPLSTATAVITSQTTGKSERFNLKNGRLERRFTQSDNLDIQVSSPGYTTASRQLSIEVPSSGSGNQYEFDAELDKIVFTLTVRAVDSQTNTVIPGGRFSLNGPVGMTLVVLTPTPVIGQSMAILPDKGTYQLIGTVEGYDVFTRSLMLNKKQNEVLIKLVARLPTVESRPTIAVATAKPAGLKLSATAVPTLSKGAVTTKTFGVIEKGRSIRLNRIYFDQSSPVLRPESYTELDQLYDVLTQYPSLRIEIRGHTDNQGDFDLNTKLSRDRCQAVIDYLVGKGTRKTRLKAIGRGPLDPVAPNNNEENRRKNRRVEFVAL